MNEVEMSDEETSVNSSGNTYYVEMKLSGKRYPAMLDTGSEVTLLPNVWQTCRKYDILLGNCELRTVLTLLLLASGTLLLR